MNILRLFQKLQELYEYSITASMKDLKLSSTTEWELALTRSIRDSETSIDFVQGPPVPVENGLRNVWQCLLSKSVSVISSSSQIKRKVLNVQCL